MSQVNTDRKDRLTYLNCKCCRPSSISGRRYYKRYAQKRVRERDRREVEMA